jgi:hypothetical protein
VGGDGSGGGFGERTAAEPVVFEAERTGQRIEDEVEGGGCIDGEEAEEIWTEGPEVEDERSLDDQSPGEGGGVGDCEREGVRAAVTPATCQVSA